MKPVRASQAFYNFVLEPLLGTKASAAVLHSLQQGPMGKPPLSGGGGENEELDELKAKGKKKTKKGGWFFRREKRWFPLIVLPSCFFLTYLLFFRGVVSEVTHGFLGGGVEIRTVEVPIEVPMPLSDFDEEDFVQSDLALKGGYGKKEDDRYTQIKDKYWLNVWRLDAEFRHAAMDKMQIPIVNLPPVDRTTDPLCDFSPLEESDVPKPDRTVYDIVLFKDESDLLEIRVHELKNVVDWFVIVQCPITFMNRTADLVDPVSIPGVAQFKHKVKRVLCDLNTYPLQETSPWKREAHMRNVAIDSILDVARDDDVILYGDLDELPSESTVERIVRMEASEFPLVLQMPLYRTNYGCLDRYLYGEEQWAGTVVTTGKLVRSREPPFHESGHQLRLELRSKGTNVIKCAGWHCSSCMDVNTIISKLSEYSHAAEIGKDQKDPDILLDEIESCHFGYWKRIRTWRGLPAYVVANAERFAYLMPR